MRTPDLLKRLELNSWVGLVGTKHIDTYLRRLLP